MTAVTDRRSGRGVCSRIFLGIHGSDSTAGLNPFGQSRSLTAHSTQSGLIFGEHEIPLSRCDMPKTPTVDNEPSQDNRKPSCSVCWQDFGHRNELDDHIRQGHPDRIIDQDELFVQAS